MDFLKKYYKILTCIGAAVLTLLAAGASWYKFDTTYVRAAAAEKEWQEIDEEILVVKNDMKAMVDAQRRAALMSQYESTQKQIYAIQNHYMNVGQKVPPYDQKRIQDLQLQLRRIEMELRK